MEKNSFHVELIDRILNLNVVLLRRAKHVDFVRKSSYYGTFQKLKCANQYRPRIETRQSAVEKSRQRRTRKEKSGKTGWLIESRERPRHRVNQIEA